MTFTIPALTAGRRDSNVGEAGEVLPGRRAFVSAAVATAMGTTADVAFARSEFAPSKTLRVALPYPEAGFDPARVSDFSSSQIVAHIFEPLFTFDPLVRPSVPIPLTASALPTVSENFRVFTVEVQPQIHFADDPVFNGRPRELVASDFVYSIKRLFDPALLTEHLYIFENQGILGLSELREAAKRDKRKFNYDVEVEGIRALSRYRIQFRLARPSPRFVEILAGFQSSAVAREVIESYADPMSRPVGTGPFRLAYWRRGSRIVLDRNPRFREQRFTTLYSGSDPAIQSAKQRLTGAKAPLLDRVEIDIVIEGQPRLLAFLGGQHDALTIPPEFGNLVMPNGSLAPFLKRKGVHAQSIVAPEVALTSVNHEDPMVGGYEPAQVALRRAISLAIDNEADNRMVQQDQVVRAHGPIPPTCSGYDDRLLGTMGSGNAASANALLDLFGFLDRDGDGWRERPDGSKLVLRIAMSANSRGRMTAELWFKCLSRVGLRVRFEFAQKGELIRRSIAGELMLWRSAWNAPGPDGGFFLSLAYGPNAGQNNDARFRMPAFDRLFEEQRSLPDGPVRQAAMTKAVHIMLAYVPYILHSHPIRTDIFHPRVRGIYRHPFNLDWFRWAEVSG